MCASTRGHATFLAMPTWQLLGCPPSSSATAQILSHFLMQMPLEIEENKNDVIAMNRRPNDGSEMDKLSEGSVKLNINR